MVVQNMIKAQGVKWWGEEGDHIDGGLSWVYFDKPIDLSDSEILEQLNMERYYQGPGQPFGHTPCVVRSKTKVLVTQNFGYDV